MKKVLTGLSFFAPALVFAQGDLGILTDLVIDIGRAVDLAIPVAFALALLAFFWGLAKYIFAAGSEEAKEGGKRIMIWGIVALFVMASVWGIVEFMQNVFDIEDTDSIDVPSVNY